MSVNDPSIIVHKLWLMLLLLITGAGQALAHEFWIEPRAYQLAVGQPLLAETRIGQMFGGSSYPYLPNWFISLRVSANGKSSDIPGRHGDKPAVAIKSPAAGLNILSYHSDKSRIKYEKWEKFAGFARKEGVPWVIDAHIQKGHPKNGFYEVYTRYGKSLIQVGDDTSADDVLVGMPYELLLLTNPYRDRVPQDITVQLWHDGKPQPLVQVSIFQKKKGQKKSSLRDTTFTDGEGKAVIPYNGGGEFLINTVQIEETSASLKKSTEALWHSHWASTTYHLPEQTKP